MLFRSTEPFVIRSMKDMIHTFPDLEYSASSAAAASSSAHARDQEQPNPPISAVLKRAIQELPKPNYVELMTRGASASEVVQHLQQQIKVLPVQTAELESQLLAEAGEFRILMQDGTHRTYAFPACMRKEQCEGKIGGIPGER